MNSAVRLECNNRSGSNSAEAGKQMNPTPAADSHRENIQFIWDGSGAGKIYKTALDVGVDEFDANVVAYF